MTHIRPQFWLQVRKDYIFDNFENLLNYLRQYVYSPGEEHPDYDATLQCMKDLSEDIGKKIRATPFYRPLDLGYSLNETLRLFCATILACNKAGATQWDIITSLIDLMMKSPEIKVTENVLLKIYNIEVNCIRKCNLVSCGFSWDDIINPDLAPSMLAINFSRMVFHELPKEYPNFFIENGGLLLIPRKGPVRLSPMNRHRYEQGNLETQFSLPDFLQVDLSKQEFEKAADFERLYQITTRILSGFGQMTPSPATQQLKTYDIDSEKFIVRVTSKRGLRIDAETIDPTFHHEYGKVLLKLPPKRPSMNALNNLIEEGDYLLVHLCEGEYRFEVIDAFEEFYRDYVCSAADQTRLAIYSCDYSKGTEWITQDGMRLGIDNGKKASFSDEETELLKNAMATRTPIELRLYWQPPRTDKDNFFAYADLPYQTLGEKMRFTIEDADKTLLENYLSYAYEAGMKIEGNRIFGSFEEASPELCIPMIAVLTRMISGGLSSCRSRLEFITSAAMLCKLLSHPEELAYMEHERKFLYAQVMFAQNKPFSRITHEPILDGLEEIERRERIIDTLSGYRKKDCTQGSGKHLEDEDVLDRVSALVDASNSLINIIDALELNNIKQVIARSLSIEDEYVSILDDRTFYGTESISLEFKTSVVFPPANRRRYASAVADPELQKWAIIKAVCGFLNSRAGGELLLGVNDAGYAVGLADDIRKLHELRMISIPEVDRYRTYVQLMLDRAFTEPDSKVSSSDITQANLTYNLEENAEGKTIMRIQVRPYRKNLVSLAAPATERPQGIEDSYVRLSGRTVPVTTAMRAEIMQYKK